MPTTKPKTGKQLLSALQAWEQDLYIALVLLPSDALVDIASTLQRGVRNIANEVTERTLPKKRKGGKNAEGR